MAEGLSITAYEPPANPQALAAQYATAYGVPVALVQKVMRAESGGDQQAVSSKGAIGLMQLMPETARGLGVDPYDPEQNVKGGVQYLRQMLDRFDGDERLALAAYNAGPHAVERHGGIPPYPETQQYVQQIAGPALSIAGYEPEPLTIAGYEPESQASQPAASIPVTPQEMSSHKPRPVVALNGRTVSSEVVPAPAPRPPQPGEAHIGPTPKPYLYESSPLKKLRGFAAEMGPIIAGLAPGAVEGIQAAMQAKPSPLDGVQIQSGIPGVTLPLGRVLAATKGIGQAIGQMPQAMMAGFLEALPAIDPREYHVAHDPETGEPYLTGPLIEKPVGTVAALTMPLLAVFGLGKGKPAPELHPLLQKIVDTRLAETERAQALADLTTRVRERAQRPLHPALQRIADERGDAESARWQMDDLTRQVRSKAQAEQDTARAAEPVTPDPVSEPVAEPSALNSIETTESGLDAPASGAQIVPEGSAHDSITEGQSAPVASETGVPEPVSPTPEGRPIGRQRTPRERRVPAEVEGPLTRPVAVELERILAEFDIAPFEPTTYTPLPEDWTAEAVSQAQNELTRGQRVVGTGHPMLRTSGHAGTPLYDLVVDEAVRQGYGGKFSRGAVEDAIRRMLKGEAPRTQAGRAVRALAERNATEQSLHLTVPREQFLTAEERAAEGFAEADIDALADEQAAQFDATGADALSLSDLSTDDLQQLQKELAGMDPSEWTPAERAEAGHVAAELAKRQPVVDVTEAGEQPRLPGDVGEVREQEIQTPEFEVPFSLAPEVARRKEIQRSIRWEK